MSGSNIREREVWSVIDKRGMLNGCDGRMGKTKKKKENLIIINKTKLSSIETYIHTTEIIKE